MEFYIRNIETGEEISTEVQEANLEVESDIDEYDFGFIGDAEIYAWFIPTKADLLGYFKYRSDYIIRSLKGE